jgi:peptidoglycan/LPS O-acetylase OafA/YrhL
MTKEQCQGHIPALDGVRGLAFLMVFLVHTVTLPAGREYSFADNLLGLGRFGVDLFFCLSGFLITGILYSTKVDRDYFKNFYIRRCLRIAPLYYLYLTAFSLLVIHFHPVNFGSYSQSDAAQAVKWAWFYALNLLVAFRGGWVISPLNHFWSLAVEEHFYLVWPFLVYWANRRNLVKVVGLICVAALFVRAILAYNAVSFEVIISFTPCRIDSFAIGGAGSLILGSSRWRGHLTRFAPFALGPTLVVFLSTYFISTAMWTTIGLTALSVFFTCLIVCAATYDRSAWLSIFRSRPLRFLGKYSYSLYVFHVPIQLYLSHKFPLDRTVDAFHSLFLAVAFRMTIVAVLSILVALLTWNIIEKPILGLRRYFSSPRDIARGSTIMTTRLEPSN